jgi:hypothetical protein
MSRTSKRPGYACSTTISTPNAGVTGHAYSRPWLIGTTRAKPETLASTALEAFANSAEPNDVLPPAGAFLRAVKKSQALRDSVAKLYRTVYADTEGLEALLSEAGVEGGRPARRALRTMDVCLRLDEGQCLVHRHEPGAVRVESVDRDDWTIDVFDGKKHLTYGAVELADNYAPAADDDFHVMALFDREG